MSRLGIAALLTVVVGVTAGCGTLRVKVDVLDPRVVEAEIDRLLMRDALPRLLGQSNAELHRRFLALQEAHRKLVVALVNEYKAEATAKGIPALTEIANGLLLNFNQTVVPFYAAEEREARARVLRIKELHVRLSKASAADRPNLEAALAAALRELQGQLESINRVVKQNVGELARSMNQDLPQLALTRTRQGGAVRQAMAEVAAQSKSLIGNYGIIESPYAYAVAAAQDDKWSPRFNEVYGVGELGNLNVAIKMVSLGQFTIKGVTFDPTDVVRAISRVSSQAVVLAAQAYGVPIRPPTAQANTPPAAGTALATSSGRLSDLQATAATREAKLQDYRTALATIALAITREQATLLGADDAERKVAIDAIKATFETHKARLNLSSLQGDTP